MSDGSDYDSFALIYSRWIGADFARRAWPVVESLLTSHVAPESAVLDLCCGSGHMARRMMDAGYHVTGIDASGNMVRLARSMAPEAVFVRADARAFSFPVPFDAVISTFNSFAHVQTSELDTVFHNVRRALRPGGVFAFDLTMEEAYVVHWQGSFSMVGDDYACVVRPTYDLGTRVATNFVTAFERNECDASDWKRSDFCIVQNCHSREAVEAALARAGFHSVQTMDAQHDLGMDGEAGRTFFLCK